MNNKKSTVSKPSRAARRRASRALKKANLGDPRMDKKWFFGWEGGKFPSPFGEITTGKIGMGSGNKGSRSDMVGLAERTDDIQVVMPRLRTESGGPYGTMDILGGTEFLTSVTNPETGALPGDILSTIVINPSLFSSTRLNQFAKLYQRYRFRRLVFWYKPIANATQSGQLIGFGDYDPDNPLVVDSEVNLSIAAAHMGQRTCKIWETTGFPFGVVDDYTSLFVDTLSSDLRLSVQGVFYLLAAGEILSSVSVLGNIYVDYEIEFYIPILAEPASLETPFLSLVSDPTVETISLNKPLGAAPVVQSYAPVPGSSLSFSSTSSDAVDVFYDSVTGLFTVNVALDGDLWIAIGSSLFNSPNGTGYSWVGGMSLVSSGDISSLTLNVSEPPPVLSNVVMNYSCAPASTGAGTGSVQTAYLFLPNTDTLSFAFGWTASGATLATDSADPSSVLYLARVRASPLAGGFLVSRLLPKGKLRSAVERTEVFRRSYLKNRRARRDLVPRGPEVRSCKIEKEEEIVREVIKKEYKEDRTGTLDSTSGDCPRSVSFDPDLGRRPDVHYNQGTPCSFANLGVSNSTRFSTAQRST